MISKETLRLAVDRALISREQADGLQALARETALAPSAVAAAPVNADDEALRLITGFADIFVTIGILLFLGALYYLAIFSLGYDWRANAVLPVGAWLLAEFFTRRRRMALPSIVLLVIFLGGAFLTTAGALEIGSSHPSAPLWDRADAGGWPVIAAAATAAVFAALHYGRFHVPITIAGGTAALGLVVFAGVHSLFSNLPGEASTALLLILGLLTFALAMWFDLSDPKRQTRRTDIAFWLHLLAAPLIVHPLIRGFVMGGSGPSVQDAVNVLGIFVLLGLVALVIDRRAMLVSGLIYAGSASGKLMTVLGWDDSNLVAPMVFLVLGAFILVISAGWRPLRRMILKFLPAALSRRLPQPQILSST